MRIEAQHTGSDPASGMIEIYATTGANLPFCYIEEDDFMEILTERQLKMWLNGVYVLNVPQKELEDKCKRLFIHNK